jgi:scyllo-inositol 2-dehydrogenase (NADP+)
MARPIKVGIVGWGLAGRTLHAPFIQVSPDLELVAAVTSRDIDASVFPAVRRHDSMNALLDDPAIELIVIATPNHLHVEQTLAALGAGKHVVCDKPLARTPREVRALADAAERAGRRLIAYQNRRFDGDFRTVEQIVRSGKLGRVHACENRWSRYQSEPRVRVAWKAEPFFNGPIYDLFPHLIDQTIVLFGRPSRVYATIAQNRSTGTLPDFVRLILDYAGGPEVVLEVDQLDAFGGRKLGLRGRTGCFEKEGADPQEARLGAGAMPSSDDWGTEDPAFCGRLRLAGSDEQRVPTLPGDYRLFYRAVVETISHGAPSPVSLEDVLCQTEIIEAALLSGESRQAVALEPRESSVSLPRG